MRWIDDDQVERFWVRQVVACVSGKPFFWFAFFLCCCGRIGLCLVGQVAASRRFGFCVREGWASGAGELVAFW